MKRTVAVAAVLAATLAAYFKLRESADDLAGKHGAIVDAWPAAEEALRQRANVLPELLQSAGSSRKSIEEAAAAVAAAVDRPTLIAAAARIDVAADQWMAEVEGSPDLPATDAAKERLREVEVDFATARRTYNSAIQTYNIAMELFPNNVAARLFGFERYEAYLLTEPPKPGAR